jgi:hypothetical protein
MRRALALGAACVVLACSNVPPPQSIATPHAPPAAPSSALHTTSTEAGTAGEGREARLVARMLDQVQSARGLEAKKPVPSVLLDRAALISRVRTHVSHELPPDAIRNEGLALQLLGFVPTQFDYESAEYQLLQDQLAGYYEPADGTMYMASDLGDEEATATLAHELVHALQDQTWNLEERSRYRPGDSDRAEALSALAEGDATSAMFDVMIARSAPSSGKTAADLPDGVFQDQIRRAMEQSQGPGAPHVMRTSLAAPYIYGTLFVHALRRRGGWEAVNRAWDDPPSTTEQIIHVDKWLQHEMPLPTDAPTYGSLGPGWTVADEDSEGELGACIAFEEWMGRKKAAETSVGWGGDRGRLLKSGDRAAFAWRLRFDDGVKAKEDRALHAYSSIVQGLSGTLGRPTTKDAKFVCYERTDRGPFAVSRSGVDLIFLAGPATTSERVWVSAGDCGLARRWMKEIVGDR